MNLADILDAVFRLYRNNFLTFIGIAALLQMPIIVLQLALGLSLEQGITTDLTQMISELPFFDPRTDSFSDLPLNRLFLFFGVSLLLSLIQAVVVLQLINGALANAVSRRYLNQPVTVLGAYDLGISGIASLIGAGLIVTLLVGMLSLLLFGCVIGVFALLIASVAQQSADTGIVVAILSIFGVIGGTIVASLLIALVAVRFLFVPQAIVLEHCGPLEALGRSWQLIRGSFWRVLGISILLGILVYILAAIPSGMLGAIVGAVLTAPETLILRQTLSTLFGYLVQILVIPLQLITYTLLYYDLRVRKEGYDLQLRAASYSPADESWPPTIQQ